VGGGVGVRRPPPTPPPPNPQPPIPNPQSPVQSLFKILKIVIKSII